GASNPDAFWQLLRNGGNAISLDRPERWNGDASTRSQPRWGGFLEEIDRFDAHFFGIAPREVVEMDPQQRLLLEVTWEALEHGGQAVDSLAGSRTAVFVGISTHDFAQILLNRDHPEKNDAYSVTGSSNSIAANRISYLFNFRGPSLAVDTACSSSLVAVHLACRSLRTGECDLALAGGVNLILTPALTEAFAKAHMMAADGRCKTFDAAADGYVRGEGCGVVVLKRLSDAYKDGDHIWAVVRGSAVNQDGRSNGLTAPNGPAQEAVIREALRDAGVSAFEIGFVEAHGSGTPLGDPIEVGALKAVMLADQNEEQHCGIGSVKTNIGHLEAAAGIAGLIKTVLALRYEEIPPNLHLDRLNPHISLAGTPFYIPSKCHPWTQGNRRRFAGVSSFGFGGTNCHVILQEAPVIASSVAESNEQRLRAERRPHLFTLSAQNETALRQLATRYETYLTEHPNLELGDVCHTANVGRSSFPYRLGVIAESISDLRERLANFVSGNSAAGVLHSQPLDHDQCRIAFLFTGQGSQYLGMGKSLYETQPVFRKELDRCDEILRPYLERPLLSVLYSDASVSSLLDQTAYTQPALFALEYALVQMWKSWGIEPSAVLGHSVGEYVAACVAGVFNLEDGLKLIATRSQLMQSLPQDGEMAAVMASESRIAGLIARYGDQVSIASVNGFDSTVISGKRTAMRDILAELDSLGIAWRRLSVSHAFHSPLMRPIIKPFEETASGIQFSSPQIMLVSNLTGQSVQPELIRTPAYWSRHSLEPVRFLEGVQTLHKSGYEIFVEIGPHPTLLNMARRCVPRAESVWLPSLRKGQDDWRQIIETLGALHIQGAKINWRGFDEQSSRRKVVLPTYPFHRQRYWLTSAEAKPAVARPALVEKQMTPSQSKPLPLRSLSMQSKAPLLKFGLMFFAASEDALVGDKYRLVVEAARFADEHGFSSVWVPERHFTKFG
ncbi:MAG TPA: beta-ketoacyl synthase N-terminal-like domain-containing protein, partial [Pyrinomonadaceae bacterium]|nr:beta-ketoacyl synthase N-terminal-like domain-containing protein [Pyrinomonadaceae bacterium]